MNKKKWEKPKLVTLVRGKSEESVLTACKYSMNPAGPAGTYSTCASGGDPGCFRCSGNSPS